MIKPDITMVVKQCTIFYNDPSQDHEESVKRICKYLLKTKAQGINLRPDKTKVLECYADTDWDGSWQHWSSDDLLSSYSRTGYVIIYDGCPIIWARKMQYLITLKTTKA